MIYEMGPYISYYIFFSFLFRLLRQLSVSSEKIVWWLPTYSVDDVATPSLLHPHVLLAWRQHTGVAKINKAQIAQPPKKNESEELKQDKEEEE